MARCYSDAMRARQTQIPRLWLISDARNDAALETALQRLPRGSGVIYRHYHLSPAERRARFRRIARIAGACGHRVVLAGDARTARNWGADGAYGAGLRCGPACLRLVTVHSMREIARLRRADAVLLSPVFATSSHPGGTVLGALRFRLLARYLRLPVIALGGIDARRARGLRWAYWAAIDGLS